MAQNRSAASRVPPSASTCRTQTCGTCRSAGTARIACFVSSHIRTVNFMPVINGGGSAEGGSTEVTAGSAPLAARSAIRPLTWSGDIDAGNCNTTVAPAGSAVHPTGVTQSRSSSPKARDRAAITEYFSGFASITRLPGRTASDPFLYLMLTGIGKKTPAQWSLLRVGLLRRVRVGESRDRHAAIIDAHDPWIGIERAVKRPGWRHLGDKTDVGNRGPRAVAEPAAFGMLGEQRLDRLQPGAEPMLDPGKPLLVADPQYVAEIVPHARHDQGVRVGGVNQGDPPHPCSRRRVAGEQRRMGVLLLKIFEDGQRLEQLD